MFAILIRERGIPVAGSIEYPSTQSVLEALKRGDIDIYPDYTGTGLVMIGQTPLADGDPATPRVQALFAPPVLTCPPRLCFPNTSLLIPYHLPLGTYCLTNFIFL